MAEREEERGFKVNDRRKFDADGKPRDEAASVTADPASGGAAEEGVAYHGESPDDPVLDFPQFLLATARLAAMFLGDIPNPSTGRPELNLGAAKQQIDLLGMLQDKTKNNLTRDEEQLLQTLLTELRLRFVEVRQTTVAAAGGKRGG